MRGQFIGAPRGSGTNSPLETWPGRNGSGGSPDTVALLISYLIDGTGQPLFEIVRRDGTKQSYRTPEASPGTVRPRAVRSAILASMAVIVRSQCRLNLPAFQR